MYNEERTYNLKWEVSGVQYTGIANGKFIWKILTHSLHYCDDCKVCVGDTLLTKEDILRLLYRHTPVTISDGCTLIEVLAYDKDSFSNVLRDSIYWTYTISVGTRSQYKVYDTSDLYEFWRDMPELDYDLYEKIMYNVILKNACLQEVE